MPLPYNDLRDFVKLAQEMGEIKAVNGVHWDKEMGAMVEMVVRRKRSLAPAFLFDRIPGYPEGYRCLFAMLNSLKRFALALGILDKATSNTMDYLRSYRELIQKIKPLPPRTVSRAPVMENVLEGDEIDILRFPAPVVHEHDAGRYIGTADGVITRDPETGWINVGTYRMQVFDKDSTGIYISPGKHGYLHLQKYAERREICPMVAIVGIDPLMWMAARYQVPLGMSEFDWAGGLKGEPLEVVQGKYTGLPIPANAEIVLEGEVRPGDQRLEGPFGEWPGYYAGGEQQEPVFRVKRVMFRNNPILTSTGSNKPPHAHLFERCFIRSAALWEGLEKAGVPNIRGVWVHEAGAGRTFNVVSIKNSYFGHTRHAGMLATQMAPSAYIGRWIIVVDDDIDPSNLDEVIWAMGTRCDPAEDVEITRKCWSSRTDPLTPEGRFYNTRAMVDACIPYEKRKDFPRVAETGPELKKKMLEKYSPVFKEILGGEIF